MDNKERAEPSLPLPVQDIVKHMRKSLKEEKTRPRRLSDVHPLHSQRHPSFSATSRCALTPTGLTSAQIFFPPLSTPHTASFVNKSTSKRKMDEYVPSLGLRSQLTASPAPSMYDKSHVNALCGNSRFSSTSMDSAVSDEVYGLDDNLEDGTLAALLTQDVINTLQQATNLNTQSDFLWSTKLGQSVTVPLINDQLSPGSDLNHINLEQDVPFSNDLLNLDQNDSKSTYTNFDSICLGMNDFSNQSRYSGVLINSPAPGIVQTTRDKTRSFETLSSPVTSGNQNTPTSDISSNLNKTLSARNNFFSRASHPQVGVAAVIKAKYDEMAFPEKESEKLLEPGQQTLNTQRLLNTKSTQIQLKQEILSPTETDTGGQCVVSGVTDFTRVVPSLGSAKRSHDGLIKTEPKSPKSLSGSVTKEESTEEKWKDIENFIYSPDDESSKKRKRYESGSSNDDDDDDDDDRSSSCEDKDDDSDDDYSDIDADLVNIRPNECESLVALGKKQKQFFWQYNVQSKGPKGTRLKLAVESPTDPHVLNEFEDPVFDECNTAIAGIRHGGKARKGDGNEITPNPRKLFMIGHQLLRLNSQINACQLGMDVPLARRNESRKEKNKLASRACRLKKKAQHEANKIKLYGLEQEHSQLNSVLRFIWPHIRERAKVLLGLTEKSVSLPPTCTPLTSLLESQISQHLKSMIAGHTVEYVNSVILKVESGDNSGGLNIKRSHRT